LAVRYADRFLRIEPVTQQEADELRSEFGNDEIEDLRLSMALFHGVSKVLIALGCEPEQMDTTILATPGSGAR
jgi:alkylhydroperoxidase family enzyme